MPETPAPSRETLLQAFVDWSAAHITGDEKGQAQVFIDRLFRAFGRRGAQEVGGTFILTPQVASLTPSHGRSPRRPSRSKR